MNKKIKCLIALVCLPVALFILAFVGYCTILTFEYVATGEFKRDIQLSSYQKSQANNPGKRLPTSY